MVFLLLALAIDTRAAAAHGAEASSDVAGDAGEPALGVRWSTMHEKVAAADGLLAEPMPAARSDLGSLPSGRNETTQLRPRRLLPVGNRGAG